MFLESQSLSIQEKLEQWAGIKLRLKINDNRSTMLSVKWEPDGAKVSLHKMFLFAPQNVMQALACYIKGKDKRIAPCVKAYMEQGLQQLDYSHELDLSKLETQGLVYDLKKLYDEINRDYFPEPLDLHITWFGERIKRRQRRINFGLYHDPLRLIKINRRLDHPSFPEYLVSFVIYHEMLHYVCPSYVNEKGQKYIHNKAFKEREKQFKQYLQAQKWVKEHHHLIF